MEVKVTKCANGHYYDVNKYDVCPHCGAGEFGAKETQKRKFGLFKRADAKPIENKLESVQPSREISKQAEDLICEDVETQGIFSDSVNASVHVVNPCVEEADATTGFFAAAEEENSYVVPAVQSETVLRDDVTVGVFAEGVAAEAKTNTLLEQVKAATDDNDVKTTGFFAPQKSADSIRQTMQQPPVGWLVCLTGTHVGKDYRVVSGKNSIGRTDDNAIALPGELSVSREKHAWVIFEPKKQEFYLKSGNESGLVYLNDENVFDVVPLHTGDVLELGDVKMVFVALCGEKFNWNNYIKKG